MSPYPSLEQVAVFSCGGSYVDFRAEAQLFVGMDRSEDGIVQAGSGVDGLSSVRGFHQLCLRLTVGSIITFRLLIITRVLVQSAVVSSSYSDRQESVRLRLSWSQSLSSRGIQLNELSLRVGAAVPGTDLPDDEWMSRWCGGAWQNQKLGCAREALMRLTVFPLRLSSSNSSSSSRWFEPCSAYMLFGVQLSLVVVLSKCVGARIPSMSGVGRSLNRARMGAIIACFIDE
ncbi:hypothetical protein Tco_1108507 [Tanacetum coccineum]